MSIGERIEQIIEDEKSQSVFNKKTGWNTGDLKGIRDNPNRSVGFDKLRAILDAYPTLSAEWLMRGEGSKWRDAAESGSLNVQIGNGNAAQQHVQVSRADFQELYEARLRDKEEIIAMLKAENARLKAD